jgi:hypothetical protein
MEEQEEKKNRKMGSRKRTRRIGFISLVPVSLSAVTEAFAGSKPVDLTS